MSFGQNVAATKIELLKYKRSSQVASMVQTILDDKRKVLLKNIEEMIDEIKGDYPETTIFCIPQGAWMIELWRKFEQGELPLYTGERHPGGRTR